MTEFKRQGGFSGGNKGGFGRGGGRPGFNRDDGNRPRMFSTTCSNCHKSCEVPFRPTGEKPVYCNDCFRNVRESSPKRRDDRSNRGGEFGGRPKRDFSPSSFSGQATQTTDAKIDGLKRRVEEMNVKLDAVLQMMKGSSAEKKKEEVPLKTLLLNAMGPQKKKEKMDERKPAANKKSSGKKK